MLLIFCRRGAEWEEEIYGAETGDTVKERELPRLCAPAIESLRLYGNATAWIVKIQFR